MLSFNGIWFQFYAIVRCFHIQFHTLFKRITSLNCAIYTYKKLQQIFESAGQMVGSAWRTKAAYIRRHKQMYVNKVGYTFLCLLHTPPLAHILVPMVMGIYKLQVSVNVPERPVRMRSLRHHCSRSHRTGERGIIKRHHWSKKPTETTRML